MRQICLLQQDATGLFHIANIQEFSEIKLYFVLFHASHIIGTKLIRHLVTLLKTDETNHQTVQRKQDFNSCSLVGMLSERRHFCSKSIL